MKPEIHKATEEEKNQAQAWPIWSKEASEFPWEYDQQETCLVLEGDVTVTNEEGEAFNFGAGDYVEDQSGRQETLSVWVAV